MDEPTTTWWNDVGREEERGTDVEHRELYIGSCIVQVCHCALDAVLMTTRLYRDFNALPLNSSTM